MNLIEPCPQLPIDWAWSVSDQDSRVSRNRPLVTAESGRRKCIPLLVIFHRQLAIYLFVSYPAGLYLQDTAGNKLYIYRIAVCNNNSCTTYNVHRCTFPVAILSTGMHFVASFLKSYPPQCNSLDIRFTFLGDFISRAALCICLKEKLLHLHFLCTCFVRARHWSCMRTYKLLNTFRTLVGNSSVYALQFFALQATLQLILSQVFWLLKLHQNQKRNYSFKQANFTKV